MPFQRTIRTSAALLAIAVVATGCASGPDFGEALEARSAQVGDIAADYKKGEKLIASGRKDIREGRNLVSKGENRIDRGEDRVRRGEALMAGARSSYCREAGYGTPECD